MTAELPSDPMDVHTYFGLTYSNYLVLHRTILQSLPEDMQHRLTAVLAEVDHWCDRNGVEVAPRYSIHARDEAGRFIKDPVPHYFRGRTRVGGAS